MRDSAPDMQGLEPGDAVPSAFPHDSEPPGLPSYQELPQIDGSDFRCAWGVFGDDDDLGTLNLLTPARRLQALALATEGITVNLDHPLNLPLSILKHRRPYEHTIFEIAPGYLDETLDGFAPQLSSQWDSLRHVRSPIGFYGGVRDDEVYPGGGRLDIDGVAKQGVIGRGVLLDVARFCARTQSPLDPSVRREIPAQLLDEVAAHQGVELRPGDVLLVRFGVDAVLERVAHGDPGTTFEYVAPGLAQESATLEWLWDKHVAAICADNIAVEVTPPRSHPERLHPALIGLLGLTLGELFNLRPLAETAERLGRYEFLFMAKPLRIPGGVGSPANAMAMF
jgi:kynurenine formamidase